MLMLVLVLLVQVVPLHSAEKLFISLPPAPASRQERSLLYVPRKLSRLSSSLLGKTKISKLLLLKDSNRKVMAQKYKEVPVSSNLYLTMILFTGWSHLTSFHSCKYLSDQVVSK